MLNTVATIPRKQIAAGLALCILAVSVVGCTTGQQSFPDDALVGVNKNINLALIKSQPSRFKGQVIELRGNVSEVVRGAQGVLITLQMPGSIIVEADEEEWTQMAFGSMPVFPQKKKIDLPTTGVLLLEYVGSDTEGVSDFPKGSMLRALGTITGEGSLSIDAQGRAHDRVLFAESSCLQIQQWNEQRNTLDDTKLLCKTP